jgi:hypothetical protein
MRIAFTTGHLNVRGTTASLFDYAYYNQTLLHNESIILTSSSQELDALGKFNRHFRVFVCSSVDDVDIILKREKADAFYIQKEGQMDGLLAKVCPNLVHCIFSRFEPHGEVYAYISKWLSDTVTGGTSPYVPYMVTLPEVRGNLREELGIPEDAIVFGRHGGPTEFCIRFARRVVKRIARQRPDVYFLFLNTRRFNKRWPSRGLKNIIYLPPTADIDYKVKFLNTCDAMLHAREEGETFGLAICEFLFQDKPVFAWNGGRDRHHIELLKSAGTLYENESDLYSRLINFRRENHHGVYRKIVDPFAPEIVMKKFKQVFLDPIMQAAGRTHQAP